MEHVWLHPAYVWDCEHCGRENFTRAVRPEMSDEEFLEAKLRFDIPLDQDGEFLCCPDSVQCTYCGAEFETLDDRVDDDYGEDAA